jgi:hypothetical protein
MHHTPKVNPNLPAHQPPMNDNNNNILVDNDIMVDPEHQNPSPNPENVTREEVTYHPLINGDPPHFYSQKKADSFFRFTLRCRRRFFTWRCTTPPWEERADDDFATFNDAVEFQLANLLFRRGQMSGTHINDLLQIWASTLFENQDPPFASKNAMYNSIDDLDIGVAPWNCFTVKYNGEIKDGNMTPWKHKPFEVWYCDPRIIMHNQLGNQEYAEEVDFSDVWRLVMVTIGT